MKLCFLDIETTGFNEKKDSILEISFLIRNKKEEIVEKFDEVFIPDKSELTPFISNLTGIESKEITKRGTALSQTAKNITDKIGDAVIVGHNIDFDIRFLVENNIKIEKNSRIDTHELSRILLINEESFALEVLAKKYGFLHTNAHRAMSDVEASIQLFDFLVKKVNELPVEFLTEIRGTLENKTKWLAKYIFLEAVGSKKIQFEKPKQPELKTQNVDDKFLDFEKPVCVRAGDAKATASFQKAIAKKLSEKQDVLIVSPKLNFFPEIKQVPIPEILFDEERFEKLDFVIDENNFNNAEITFWLKCKLRHFLEFRGKDFFDLFAYEREFWSFVSRTGNDDPVFVKIMQERSNEKILAISPAAYFRFQHSKLLKNRLLIVDEVEIFTEKLAFSAAEEFSLAKFLNSKNEKESIATQFFVTEFCRDFIEAKTKHQIGPFPEKILIENRDDMRIFAKKIMEISDNEELLKIADFLNTSFEKSARWVKYFPESGNLIFGLWKSEKWEETKNNFAKAQKIIFHRSFELEKSRFFYLFTGEENFECLENKELFSPKKLIIPEKLKSATSPEFNDFCADKIVNIFANTENEEKEHFIAVNFSSLDSMRKVFTTLVASSITHDFEILGERVSGGNGKVLTLLRNKKRAIFLTQKCVDPKIEDKKWSAIVVQKFPFNPPHPLFDFWKSDFGNIFWDLWIVPMVAANLARRVSSFGSAEKIFILDPRENSSWGKNVLKAAFPEAHFVREDL
jgi:DNA polymerase III epsilon subunit-like protein